MKIQTTIFLISKKYIYIYIYISKYIVVYRYVCIFQSKYNTISKKYLVAYRFEITLFHSCSELVSNNICVCDVCFFALLLPLMSKHYWLASCTIHVVLSHRFWTFWQVIQLGIMYIYRMSYMEMLEFWFHSLVPPFPLHFHHAYQAIHQLQIGHTVQYTTL